MLRVAFITGRSDARSCALSPTQQSFLDAIARPGLTSHPVNFPYRTTGADHRERPLIVASVSNARDFLLSRHQRFRLRHRPTVRALLDEVPHTLLLAGSCGLELLANLDLPVATLQHVSVFAYGPVARAVPACRLMMVQGRRDRLSRLFFPRVTHVVDCGHLGYLSCSGVVELCKAFIADVPTNALTQLATRDRNESADAH